MSDIQAGQTADAFTPVITGSGGVIASFNDQIFIHPDKHLPGLDHGTVKAYAASGMPDVSQVNYFAMICDPSLTPRNHSAASYATISNSGLLKLIASGPVYWPPARGERYTFIYELPVGRPLTPEGQYTGLGMKPDTVLNAVLRPIGSALGELRDAGIAHGNIRPSTIYGVGTSVLERVILGECLSAPTSFAQVSMFEPIERAMAMPLGRGPSKLENDAYSLGVSLAVMLRTRDPMEGMNDEDMIRYRIENGSLNALTSKDRIAGNIIELLRGLLQDDRAQRWSLADAINWMDGQHISQRQGFKKAKAARPLIFEEERYFRPALLAMDLNKNQSGAAQLIETSALEQWISRSLEDSTVLKRLETAIDSVEEQGHGPGYWDRLLCRVSIALDPDAPIRYKGLSIFPDAVGASLAAAIMNRTDLQPYIDIINQQTATNWATAQPDTHVDLGSVVTRFDSCRAFLRQSNIAYGIERCLYLLNPGCPCLSEKLRSFYVRTPEDMMRAFEKMSGQPNRPQLFFDRHIIAFLSVKDRKDVDSFLIELNSEDMYKKILGNIKTLATIQQRSRMEKMPGVCKWIADILDPVYERLHDRQLRMSVRNRISQLVDTGDIAKIAAVLDNPQTMGRDTDYYNNARTEYYNLRLEANELEQKLSNPALFGRSTGREAAALVSCILSGLAILFFVFKLFARGSVF